MKGQGARKIAQAFNAKYEKSKQMTVSHTYVVNKRRDHEYEILHLNQEIKHNVPKPVAKNLTWSMDLVSLSDQNKNQHKALGIIDYGSRAELNACLEHCANASIKSL